MFQLLERRYLSWVTRITALDGGRDLTDEKGDALDENVKCKVLNLLVYVSHYSTAKKYE